MAMYTVELGTLIDRGFLIFDDTWTTFDPGHKPELCDKIVRRYRFYEIGQETPDKFAWYINEHLARMMPYWNELYKSCLVDIIPNYNLWVEGEDEGKTGTERKRDMARREDINSIRKMAQALRSIANGTSDRTGNEKTTGSDDWTEKTVASKDGSYSEDTVENSTGNEDYTGKDVFAGKETGSATTGETVKEVMSDTVTGTKKVNTTADGTTSNERRYSDTPQGTVSTSGVAIDRSYLTNYTAESGFTHSTGSQDETLNNQDDKTTDTTRSVDSTNTVDKSSTTDQTHSKDTTGKVTGNKDGESHEDSTQTVTGNRDTTGNTDTIGHEDTSEHSRQFSNGSESLNDSRLSGEGETAKESIKSSSKNVKKGFTIPQSQLIMEYRKAIINVDNIIIEAMGEHFMGVF